MVNILFMCMTSRSNIKKKAIYRNIFAGCVKFAIVIGMNIAAYLMSQNVLESEMTTW
jgi:hypothetical protein